MVFLLPRNALSKHINLHSDYDLSAFNSNNTALRYLQGYFLHSPKVWKFGFKKALVLGLTNTEGPRVKLQSYLNCS